MIFPVILAGGKGERFWPRSRANWPKQFLSLNGQGSLLQQTVFRIKPLAPLHHLFVVSGANYLSPIKEQLPELLLENIIVEPMGRNTAACIGLAAIHLERLDPEGIMVVLPSDHLIHHHDQFLKTIQSSVELANQGENMVTIGIRPTYPETGYGYINFGKKYGAFEGNIAFEVRRFVEKPVLERAKAYLESGKYLWNSGMFVWKVSTIRKAICEFMPKLHIALEKMKNVLGTENEREIIFQEFIKLENISVDLGIMEYAENILVFPGDFGWDDVGTWTALERIHDTDPDGNIFHGNVVVLDSKKCIVEGRDKLIAAVGVEDLIIVESDDALLVCSKDHAQNIKDLLKKLKQQRLEKYL